MNEELKERIVVSHQPIPPSSEIVVGATVRLREYVENSLPCPRMLVRTIDPEEYAGRLANCEWFTTTGELKTCAFYVERLVRV